MEINRDQLREMIAICSDVDALTEDVIDSVVKRSDGVSIFPEELVSLILEGKRHPAVNEIPSTLLDSLNARLDRLGPARHSI
jgi:hypothetical protein